MPTCGESLLSVKSELNAIAILINASPNRNTHPNNTFGPDPIL